MPWKVEIKFIRLIKSITKLNFYFQTDRTSGRRVWSKSYCPIPWRKLWPIRKHSERKNQIALFSCDFDQSKRFLDHISIRLFDFELRNDKQSDLTFYFKKIANRREGGYEFRFRLRIYEILMLFASKNFDFVKFFNWDFERFFILAFLILFLVEWIVPLKTITIFASFIIKWIGIQIHACNRHTKPAMQ